MKKKHTLLECLFGHHDYGKELTKDKDGDPIYLCKICKRSSYVKWRDGEEVWRDYDKDGNCTYVKFSNGVVTNHLRYRYDEKGCCIYSHWSYGNKVLR